MTRYVVDAPTLVHLVAEGVEIHADHQLVAPSLIRSQSLNLLLEAVDRGDLTEAAALQYHALVSIDPAMRERAADIVPLAPITALLAD